MPGKTTRAVLLVVTAAALLGGLQCISYTGGLTVSAEVSVRESKPTYIDNLIERKTEGITEPTTLLLLGMGISLAGAAMRRQYRRGRNRHGKSES